MESIKFAENALNYTISNIYNSLSIIYYELIKIKDKKLNINEIEYLKLVNKKNILEDLINRTNDLEINKKKKLIKLNNLRSKFSFLLNDSKKSNDKLVDYLNFKNKKSNFINEIDMKYYYEDIGPNCILNSCTILNLTDSSYIMEQDIYFKNYSLFDETLTNMILEKISFLIITLYALSTENRFKEEFENIDFSKNKRIFQLGNKLGNNNNFLTKNFKVKKNFLKSEFYLSKSFEYSYLYMLHTFPFVIQIFNVYIQYKNYIPKYIPEDEECEENLEYLLPLKNGLKVTSFCPIIRRKKNISFKPKNNLSVKTKIKFDNRTHSKKKDRIFILPKKCNIININDNITKNKTKIIKKKVKITKNKLKDANLINGLENKIFKTYKINPIKKLKNNFLKEKDMNMSLNFSNVNNLNVIISNNNFVKVNKRSIVKKVNKIIKN